MNNGLKFVEETSWTSVQDAWREREEEIWRAHYQERGFKTWDEWRNRYSERYNLPDRTWTRYEIIDPSSFIPEIYVGAFGGWKKYYPEGAFVTQFKDLDKGALAQNEGVQYWDDHIPAVTEVILFHHEGVYSHFDGTHRMNWAMLRVSEGKEISTRFIASIAEFASDEAKLFRSTYTQNEN